MSDIEDILSGKVFPVACEAFAIIQYGHAHDGHIHRCVGVNCSGVLHECFACGEFFTIPGDLFSIQSPSNPLLDNRE